MAKLTAYYTKIAGEKAEETAKYALLASFFVKKQLTERKIGEEKEREGDKIGLE